MNLINGPVMVSGATGGIGRMIATRLVDKGYQVAILGRTREKINGLEDELSNRSSKQGNVIGFTVDIRDDNQVRDAITKTNEHFGTLKHLVQAAGDGPVGSFLTVEEDQWQQTWNTKMMGSMRLVRAFTNSLLESGEAGTAVLINGVFSKEPSSLCPINSAVNAALSGFAKSVATELARSKIRLNIVNPGATQTGLWESICIDIAKIAGSDPTSVNQSVIDSTPLGILTAPEDIANAVEFLLSDLSKNITGTELTIDGGACHSL